METKCKYQAGELYHLVGMLLMNWGWWQFHLSVMKVYHYFIIDQQTCYKYESVWSKKKIREIKFHEIIFTKIFVKLISQKKEFWSKNYVNTLWCSNIVSNIFFDKTNYIPLVLCPNDGNFIFYNVWKNYSRYSMCTTFAMLLSRFYNGDNA